MGILYLPQLTALVLGPALLNASSKPMVASSVTLAFGVIQVMRRSGKAARIGGTRFTFLSALNALAISHMLRA